MSPPYSFHLPSSFNSKANCSHENLYYDPPTFEDSHILDVEENLLTYDLPSPTFPQVNFALHTNSPTSDLNMLDFETNLIGILIYNSILFLCTLIQYLSHMHTIVQY